ncbi:MAG TPA: hypothetical protein VGI79_10185 [Caulobacteraceae bacterium]
MRHAAMMGLAALCIGMPAPSLAAPASPWPDTYLGHVEALAVMEDLNSALLASHSATSTLEAWCADHHMAEPPRISAQRVLGADKSISPEQRQHLQVGPDEPIHYRRVRLACGDHVLSEADNWYVPARLTPEMNRLLDTTDIPFGRVIQPLHPSRQTLTAEQLWSPLPANWDVITPRTPPAVSAAALVIPAYLFRHRAIVFDDQRRPFAEVIETYTGESLNFSRSPTR